jgi:hypothetical protein
MLPNSNAAQNRIGARWQEDIALLRCVLSQARGDHRRRQNSATGNKPNSYRFSQTTAIERIGGLGQAHIRISGY